MQRFLFVLVSVALLVLVGCRTPQTVKDAWKGTRSYYYEYLNTPAQIDLDSRGNVQDYQAALGFAVADFDVQLQELERALQNSDRNPDAAWVSAFTTRFPWISGVALTDEEGIPRAQIPPEFAKPFDIGPLIEVDPKQQIKDLRAYVKDDPLGPEIYVGNPVYVGAEFRGVITVHFDPRVLLARASDAAQVVIAGPGGIIWPGIYDPAATPLAGIDWAERVKSNVYGIERNEFGAFYWICRYLGNLPLIYAIRIQGDFPVQEENLRSLVEANNFAIGSVDFSRLQAPEPPRMPEGPEDPGTPPMEITPDGQNSPLRAPDPLQQKNGGQDAMPLVE